MADPWSHVGIRSKLMTVHMDVLEEFAEASVIPIRRCTGSFNFVNDRNHVICCH